MLKEKNYANILDYGCAESAIKFATHACDIFDYSNFYKNKQFDFIFCSHVAEHVSDPKKFCSELMRVGKTGYIEIPLPLFDNVIYGNPSGHKWWVEFCDDNEKLIFSPRKNVVKECITTIENNTLYKYFRGSIVTELYWEESFEVEVKDSFIYHYSPDTIMNNTEIAIPNFGKAL
jgi:SAM-dependent methyltransferase